MMCERFVLAGISALASVLFWGGYWVLFPDRTALAFGGVSVASTVLIGLCAGPRLAADADRTRDPTRGYVAGALLTLAVFVLGAFMFALLPLLTMGGFRESGVVAIVSVVLQLFALSLVVGGVIFLLPALPLGMCGGWLFYRLRLWWYPRVA